MEAAIRRFSHFGITKTTLTEIAEDLAVSKQSLAYYFPDKQSLVMAVEDKISSDYIDNLRSGIILAASVEQALMKLSEIKIAFFEKYFMLAMQAEHIEHASGRSLTSWKQKLSKQEIELLVPLFERGVQQGEIKPLDAAKTAELFLDTLHAFSRCIKDKGAFPQPDAFKEILTKQQEVIALFYKGLKK